MKRYFSPALLLVMALFVSATQLSAQRAKAYEGQVSYQKSLQSVILMDLPYPPGVVEDAIKDYMGRNGWKSSSSRGYKVYKNMKLEDGAANLNDLHIDVERKTSRDNTSCIVTAIPARAGEDPATRSGKDEALLAKTMAFMNRLVPAIEAADLEDRIKSQDNDTKKAQHKLGSLHDEQGSLEKKIRNTEEEQKENKADQIKEAQAQQQPPVKNDPKALAKSQKKLEKLKDEESSLAKKLVKYQSDLEQNKKNQEFQKSAADAEQKTLDSLKSQRKN